MLNRDFKEFAELLNARGVDYLGVGGYALAAHGHPRYTGDSGPLATLLVFSAVAQSRFRVAGRSYFVR